MSMSSLTPSTRTLVRTSLVLAVFIVSAGCASTGGADTRLEQPPPGTVSVYTVAERLSLDVVASEPDHVVLRDALNSVLFFGGKEGRAYANGMPIAVGAPVVRVDGTYYVPEQLVDEVRAVLRHVPVSRPPVTVEPEPPAEPPQQRPRANGLRVVVDPGHGGRDPGATAVTGHSEKWINLSVAKKLAARLKKRGYDVRLTRTKDVFVELNRRAAIANQVGADLFVSIHADACGTPSVRGSSVYICREASARSCATAGALVRALEDGPLPARGLRRADFRVLVRTRCPAVLVECGFLTNRKDTALLLRRDIQDRIVQALANGIDTATRGW
jgi:N-acetylmuramoyl-L-alanine amidase